MDFPKEIDSIFRFILIVGKRARQLQAGARPRIQTLSKRSTLIARAEVQAGLVGFLVGEPDKAVSLSGSPARRSALSAEFPAVP